MKTIGKKVKAIYIMAVIALVSICMSLIPLMTNTVKADATATDGLRITGAQVKVIDEAYKTENDSDDFAMYFHTEMTKQFYDGLVGEGNSVQIGMLVGPSATISGFASIGGEVDVETFDAAKGTVVSSREVEGLTANFRFIGTGLEEVSFTNDVMTFEAGIVFNIDALLAGGGTDAGLSADDVAKLAASTKLSAIPYYVVNGFVTMNALDAIERTAKDVLVETKVRIEKECSDSTIDLVTINTLLDKYVGIGAVEILEKELYVDKNTGALLAPNANNELVDFTGEGIDMTDVTGLTLAGVAQDKVDFASLTDGAFVGLAISYADGSVTVIPARVATRVFFTVNDFFYDENGDGAIATSEKTIANYIFNLQAKAGSGARLPSIAIKGYFVLANNIDLGDNTQLTASALGDQTVQIFDGAQDVGFRATLDGRGFALINGAPSGSSAGMFGAFYGATIKNIAFDGFTNGKNDGSTILLGYTYNSTFENVYIRAKKNGGGDGYKGQFSMSAFGVSDQHGPSTFTNVIFEALDGLTAGATNKNTRAIFGAATDGVFENTTIVGMPVSASFGETEKGSRVYVLSLTMPASVMSDLGVEADQYEIASLPTAVTNVYGNLITNVKTSSGIDFPYVKFVEDTKEGRSYYYDKSDFFASETSDLYEEFGYWTKMGEELVWNSLIDESKISVKTDSANNSFKDSIEVDMYYGEDAMGAEIAVSGAGAEFVEVNGNTISRKADVNFFSNQALTATLSYKGYTKTVDLTLLFDIDKVVTYESGEFVIDKYTGKVLKANAKNELVAYNATSYLADSASVTVDGVAQTVVNPTEFTLDKANLASLADGEKLVIAAGEKYLVAQVATKVFFTLNDLFVDEAEMTQANFIFALTANKVITGYYVLANNIDLAYNGNLTACSGETAVPSGASFQATLDGRGFAFTSVQLFTREGMFGALSNATIKNIAFINMRNVRNNGASTYLASRTSASTIENVYLTIDEYWLTWNQADRNTAPVFGGISNSTFTNVLFENNAWKSSNTSYQRSENSWAHFSAMATSGTYNNVNSIGAPSTIARSTHISATAAEDGVAKHKLTITLPLATINKYVATPGIYALADCGGAEVDYARLIAGINLGDGLNIQYIEFIADTTARGYYYDNAALGADTAVAKEYADTGMWIKAGNTLLWASLADESKVTVNASSLEFKDSTTVDIYYDGVAIEGAELSVSKEDAEFVEISGNVITKKADAVIFADKNVTVTVSSGNFAKTIDLTLLFDIDSVETYEQGEFIIDKSTGKLLKANDNKELVVYNATSYLGSATEVVVGESAQIVTNTTEFAFDKANLASLADGEKYIIKAGENLLVARAVTKVFFNANDFFNDTDGDNVGDIAAANYIFAIDITGGKTTAKHTGYYVLANNIDTAYNGALIAHNSSSVASNTSDDVGFQGTLDGRGFALSNLNVFNCSGMFGILKNATIKDIALTNFYNTRDDANARYIASYIVNSTIENVYISIGTKTLGYDQPYRTATPIFGTISSDCTLENVLFENNIWKSDSYNKNENAWAFLSSADTSTNSNVNSIGIPNAVARSQQIASTASDDGIAKYKLTLTLPSATIAAYGVQTGTVYAITDEVAAAAVADYQKLIDGIHAYDGTSRGTKKFDLTYIEFVAETTNRGYYYDNAKLVADATAADAYVATGFWKVSDGALVWASL